MKKIFQSVFDSFHLNFLKLERVCNVDARQRVQRIHPLSFSTLILAFTLTSTTFAQDNTSTTGTSTGDTTTQYSRQQIDSTVQAIRDLFDELLDIEVGKAALQARHISNVGYGLDNAIGLNRELRDTFAMLRDIVQSEFFIKSAIHYDHFYTRLLNRKNYSPNENELGRQFGGELYAGKIYFDVVFSPAWDTMAMDVDAAREANLIAWKCRIDVSNMGTFNAEFSAAEMDSLMLPYVSGKNYADIKREATADANQGLFAGLGWLAEKFGFEPYHDPSNIKRVDFTAPVAQGYDQYDNKGILFGNYENIAVGGKQYYVPWKSARANGGRQEYVFAQIVPKDPDSPIEDSIEFVSLTGTPVPNVVKTGDFTYKIQLPNMAPGDGDGIVARYTYTDSTGKEITMQAGQVGIATYTVLPKSLVIVPVISDNLPIGADSVKKFIDRVYGPAGVDWTVTVANGFRYAPAWEDGTLDDGQSGTFSNYTTEMNDLIDAFKDFYGSNYDKNKSYLFLVEKPKSGSKCGYMPLTRRFGFIFTDQCADELAHTIAHELGHGPFHLYHTFSNENDFTQAQGSTDNLMDYSGASATSLYKYQWDYIQDPQSMIGLLQDEEEGEYIYKFLGKKFEVLFDKVYSKNYTLNTEYYDKIQSGETNNFVPEFTDDELKKLSDEEKAWVKKWEVRARKSNDVLLDVIDAIQKASAGDKMSKIIAQQNKVYIVKCKFDDYDFNVAIYGHGDGTTLNKIFTKVVVGKIDDLSLEENQKHLYIDINEGRDYWILALFEDGKKEPSLIVQISGKYNILKAEKWLTYLNIINPKLATLDKDPNFDWMEDVSLDDDNVSEEKLANIIKNRGNVNDRTDKSIYGKDAMRLTTYCGRTGYMYKGDDVKEAEVTGETEFEKEVLLEILNELQKEGGFSGINAYDGQIITWGKGFAQKGQLNDLLDLVYNNEQIDFKQVFNNVGIKMVDKHIWILDDEGNWLKDASDDYKASNYIRDNPVILSFLIELAEKEDYAQEIANMQWETAKEKAGKYPSYIMNDDKTAYVDNWNHTSVTVLCHLSHFLTAYSWKEGNRYKDTKGNLDKIIYTFIYETARKSPSARHSPTLETNIYRWHRQYDILRSLGMPNDKGIQRGVGNPSNAGWSKFKEKWTDHKIEIESKEDDNGHLVIDLKEDADGKIRAVKKGTTKYISNSECVIIKIDRFTGKDNVDTTDDYEYYILTKDHEKITYGEFKEKKEPETGDKSE